jgi:hypothetical protein
MSTELREFQIEREYDQGCAHARSMFHMAVQAAEIELEKALAHIEDVRQGRLSDARRTALSAAGEGS